MDLEQPLLPHLRSVRGAVDHRGLPAPRATTGGRNSLLFIIGMEVAERFAFYGLPANLITYLTGKLGMSLAAAAAIVNAWSGTVSLLVLLGEFLVDSRRRHYKSIVGASLLYLLGLSLLTLSTIAPALRPKCTLDGQCSATEFQITFFLCSLFLLALAQGGQKPFAKAFAADQFDEDDPEECELKSSFFNWLYYGMCCGVVVALVALSYIQDNISWGLGFGISGIVMAYALLVFLVGRKTYRYQVQHHRVEGGWMESTLVVDSIKNEQEKFGSRSTKPHGTRKEEEVSNGENYNAAHSKLLPIWITCIMYAVLYAQSTTFFTKQGSTMDHHIGPSLQLAPAAMLSFTVVASMATVPIYDRILVPLARAFTAHPSGITSLQRIGAGMLLSTLSIVIAALVEMKRLKAAKESGVLGSAGATVPMRLWWLVPQYVLFGVADVFTVVGMQEFYCDQVPKASRSLVMALCLGIFGTGSFISGLLVTIIDNVSRGSGESWFSDNLIHAHLDYFYLLLAGLSAIQFLVFLCFSRAFVYKD